MLKGQFGIPYMGSKGSIVDSIAMVFPPAKNFYDLFGGGFSVSHYMAQTQNKKYECIHYNEIKSDIVQLVKDSICGKYSYENFKPEWVSRKKFFASLDNAYIRVCWSFGNDQRTYLFSEDIEYYKCLMHLAIVFDEFNDLAEQVLQLTSWPKNINTIPLRRLYLFQIIDHYRKTKLPSVLIPFLSKKQKARFTTHRPFQKLERFQQLQQLQQLENLERLQRLQRLERLRRLENLRLTSKSYDQVEILPNSVVYCDIPYEGTKDYGNSFDKKTFLDWAASRSFPVYISEYEIKDSRFECVYKIQKSKRLDNSKDKKDYAEEKIYWNKVKLSKSYDSLDSSSFHKSS